MACPNCRTLVDARAAYTRLRPLLLDGPPLTEAQVADIKALEALLGYVEKPILADPKPEPAGGTEPVKGWIFVKWTSVQPTSYGPFRGKEEAEKASARAKAAGWEVTYEEHEVIDTRVHGPLVDPNYPLYIKGAQSYSADWGFHKLV